MNTTLLFSLLASSLIIENAEFAGFVDGCNRVCNSKDHTLNINVTSLVDTNKYCFKQKICFGINRYFISKTKFKFPLRFIYVQLKTLFVL